MNECFLEDFMEISIDTIKKAGGIVSGTDDDDIWSIDDEDDIWSFDDEDDDDNDDDDNDDDDDG